MEKNSKKNNIEENDAPLTPSVDVPVAMTSLDSEDVSTAQDGTPEKRENTRSTMAILFVLGFFSILFLCFVYAIMVNATLGELKDALIGIAGALSGTLGFIVGYYYKSAIEQ